MSDYVSADNLLDEMNTYQGMDRVSFANEIFERYMKLPFLKSYGRRSDFLRSLFDDGTLDQCYQNAEYRALVIRATDAFVKCIAQRNNDIRGLDFEHCLHLLANFPSDKQCSAFVELCDSVTRSVAYPISKLIASLIDEDLASSWMSNILLPCGTGSNASGTSILKEIIVDAIIAAKHKEALRMGILIGRSMHYVPVDKFIDFFRLIRRRDDSLLKEIIGSYLINNKFGFLTFENEIKIIRCVEEETRVQET